MSVINKMLNDLDDRKDTEQASEEVAFMQPTQKPKRKWLVTLVSSIVLGLGAIWGTYYFYEDLLELAGVQVAKPPKVLTAEEMQARIAASEAQGDQQSNSAAAEGNQTAVNGSEQPELIILKPNTTDGNPAERPSTLSVVSVESPAQQEVTETQSPDNSGNQEDTQNSTLVAQNQPQNNAEMTTPDSADDNTGQTFVSPSDQPIENGAPKAAEDKMQVSKVQMSPQKRAQKAYNEAKEFSKGGMIVEAIDKYKDVLRFKPDHQDGRSELAALYYGRNMTLEALQTLDGGLEIDPANLGWSLLAAKIHYKRTNFSAALAYLQLPVETYDNIEYIALKATTSYKLKEYQGAMNAYQQLTVADPGNGRWWLGLGTTHEAMGQDVQAVRAYRKSLRLSNISTSSRQFVMSRLQRLSN